MTPVPPRRRRRLSLASRVRLVLALLALAPLLAVGAALATAPATETARNAARRLLPAQLAVEQLRTSMLDQETGLRGFLLTGDQTFLGPYTSGRSEAERSISSLRSLLTAAPYATDLAAVESAKNRWQATAEQARQASLVDPESLRARKTLFDAVRETIDHLDTEVEARISALTRRYDNDRRRRDVVLGGTLATVVLLAIGGAVLLVHWLERPLAELSADLLTAAANPEVSMDARRPRELAALADRAESFRVAVLDESRDRLRRGLVVAQEDERRRIAGGLHDEVIQSLSAAALRLQALETTASPADRTSLLAIRQALGEAIERLRRLLFELSPPALERSGIVAALESFGLGLGLDGERITVAGDEGSASLAAQAIAYRAAREAIVNAVRHARASTISVTVEAAGGGVGVRIADDGQGFDPATTTPRPGHLGLRTAEELVVGSSGHWAVDSAPGRGATVSFWIPDPEAG